MYLHIGAHFPYQWVNSPLAGNFITDFSLDGFSHVQVQLLITWGELYSTMLVFEISSKTLGVRNSFPNNMGGYLWIYFQLALEFLTCPHPFSSLGFIFFSFMPYNFDNIVPLILEVVLMMYWDIMYFNMAFSLLCHEPLRCIYGLFLLEPWFYFYDLLHLIHAWAQKCSTYERNDDYPTFCCDRSWFPCLIFHWWLPT